MIIPSNIADSPEYDIITAYYLKKATSHGVPLMNHINEGIYTLLKMNADENTILAWCIHPIMQGDVEVDVSWSDALDLAQEYALRANSYLCIPATDYILNARQLKSIMKPMSQECAQLLITDKLQNYTDFMIFNREHPRAVNLERYFSIWLQYLRTILK